MLSSRHPNTLHLLAGSSTTTALDAARALLVNGANACVRADEGLTPLHVACAYDCLAMAQLLMHYGADPEASDDHGRTPFSMATGSTHRFLQRMLTKSTRDQRGIIHRLFACHTAMMGVNKVLMRGIRRKWRRSLGAIGCRRPPSESLPVTEMEPTTPTAIVSPMSAEKDAQESSNGKPSSSHFYSGYLLSDRMPHPSSSRTSSQTVTPVREGFAEETRTPYLSITPEAITRTPKAGTIGRGAEANTSSEPDESVPRRNTHASSPGHEEQQHTKISSRSMHSAQEAALNTIQSRTPTSTVPVYSKSQCQPSAPSIEQLPDDDFSCWLSEKDNSHDTQETDIYLTADESFDMTELQQEIDQTGKPILSPSDEDALLRKIRRLNDAQLRAELKKGGITAGPMCERTRKIYEKKLLALQRGIADTKGARYSRQLELAMMGIALPDTGKVFDNKIRKEFEQTGVSAFCYLLLDPRMITTDVESLDLKIFVPAIFYVGKGTKARPLAHLIEAKKEREAKSPKVVSDVKLRRIDSIWGSDNGVLCLQINHNVSDDEAFVREAALIEAIRLENLTNIKGGEWRGSSRTWTFSMRAEFGTYQLQRALGVLKMEGLRPIKPEALPESLFPFSHRKNP